MAPHTLRVRFGCARCIINESGVEGTLRRTSITKIGTVAEWMGMGLLILINQLLDYRPMHSLQALRESHSPGSKFCTASSLLISLLLNLVIPRLPETLSLLYFIAHFYGCLECWPIDRSILCRAVDVATWYHGEAASA